MNKRMYALTYTVQQIPLNFGRLEVTILGQEGERNPKKVCFSHVPSNPNGFHWVSLLFWKIWFFLCSSIWYLSIQDLIWRNYETEGNNVTFIFCLKNWINQWWLADFMGNTNRFTTWPDDSCCPGIDKSFHAGGQRKIMLYKSSFHNSLSGLAGRLQMLFTPLIALGEHSACACLNIQSSSTMQIVFLLLTGFWAAFVRKGNKS